MLKCFWSCKRSIFSYMSDNEECSISSFPKLYKFLGDVSHLSNTPRCSWYLITLHDTDRVNDSYFCRILLKGRKDIFEIWFCKYLYIFSLYLQSLSSFWYLILSFFSTDIYHIVFYPFPQSKCQGRFPDSRFSRKEDNTPLHDSSS